MGLEALRMPEMSEDAEAKLSAARMGGLIEDAKREDVARDECRVLARLTEETALTDPWTAATNLFGGSE